MYYNDDWKKEYSSQFLKNSKTYLNRLRRFSKFEERLEKDLCEMNIDQITSSFIALNIISSQELESVKSVLINYVDWCIETGRTSYTSNVIHFLDTSTLVSNVAVKSKMIKSPDQVRHILNTVHDEGIRRIYPNRTTMNSLLVWLIYSDIPDDEIEVLKKDSINFKKKTVNGYYEVYDDVLPLWRAFSNIDYVESDKRNTGHVAELKFLNNDYLFRGFDNERNRFAHMGKASFKRYLRNLFVSYYETTGEYMLLGVENMRVSGLFYKLYISNKTDEQVRKELVELNKGKDFVWRNYLSWRNVFYSDSE